MRTIECVTNYSEGRDLSIIEQICHAIDSIEGVCLLNCDPGYATNRTVITFAGDADAVCEAAFQAAKKAAELIDMRLHNGTHPRLGATDVLPLIPLEGVTLEECALLARSLAQRIATELLIPTYCYEAAAFISERKRLEICRKGGYEALASRVMGSDAPDYGDRPYDEAMARTGATIVGARDFLIAVNFNLDTSDRDIAHAIACDIRTSNKCATSLKCCKAIGWYIEEYGKAQVSTNLTDISTTPLHIAFEAISRAAEQRGQRVTGVEIIGLVPQRVLVEAGHHFAAAESGLLSDDQAIDIASKYMNLSELTPFIPDERILEKKLLVFSC